MTTEHHNCPHNVHTGQVYGQSSVSRLYLYDNTDTSLNLSKYFTTNKSQPQILHYNLPFHTDSPNFYHYI